MIGTTTVYNLDIQGALYYNGHMLSMCGNSTSSPCITQDSGNISLGLAIIIVVLFLMVVGFIFNNISKKKPWH